MAGGLDYLRQTAEQQRIRDEYIKGLQVPPGPPTQHGIYTTPEWTGEAYPSIDWEAISQNQEPPEGWPRYPRFNEPGDVPGPPVQFGEAITNANVKAGYGFIPNGVEERNLYYYHPDHLGSSSYITDKNGEVIQHTEYMAFGEILVDEHSTSNKMPYLFNGKELDYETGLYYYGARYYDPKTSIFLNVDPLVEKTMTPYAYVNNNPINLIDPTGMAPEDWVQTETEMIYDSRVTDQKTAVELYGDKAKYRAVGYKYTSKEGNEIELGDYGFYKKNGNVAITTDRAQLDQPIDYSGDIMIGGLAVAGTLVADDITGIGIVDDVAIPPIVAGAAAIAIAAKATYEIQKIMDRDTGPQGYQYALVAKTTGMYPIYSVGSSVPTGSMFLNAGDVWKYGETTTKRYTETYKSSIGGGVREVPQFFGNQRQIKIAEKSKIYGYFLKNGHLPPGNKIFR